ncbi:alanine--tRNA ligase [Helicobacter pylori]|uniref:Alanine--tRNA ligase n=2 Tax=Helicobacter pylori TaxID=210 RepID=SYA_HELPJ|nr:alanine--tRNA ligase [Helicobacter pylori]Q9ZJY5.1 RecName: Full=Alanine--tRNA ligase; AltName: Full=Alanyl-tRNA synthetase; Short=AlaRS [Helicobacter pylori J99]AAD06738.1 ALANYL-TRNA SYNTHETASE [Helicobacter pylori J99]AKE82294.1 alanyl-tRNA synthetase [Helicobacter pylori J99]AVL48317.1 alanine--tRNA ligase [Helicobacter pylori]MWR19751.1 alanine--tRNA ligase [Helicobacter pylori]MWR35580.1 alanine--tRNA ligase [Helicobacter pylori]
MDIRNEFLQFFQNKGHEIYPSMPLVPNDATLLFTNAGMVQFKDIFTGIVPRPSIPRAASSQLCMRAGGKHNDLENVGYTARHHTLFEMLGNFSFGDYFKEEAILFAWEFVTKNLGFKPKDLYISVHEKDDEAVKLWEKFVPVDRIKKMGDKDNFWQMGDSGPCGPCSEIYIDQGEKHFKGSEDYFGGEGDRFLEIWNLVFMQYERSNDGVLSPLPKPSIDTGMGLERVQALLEHKLNNFDSSLFAPLMEEISELTGLDYASEFQPSFRVVADHARAVAFLLAQEVHFNKEGRGYVLRRILRRALRHGYLMGLKEAFLYKVVGVVCEQFSNVHAYLKESKEMVMKECFEEEERFLETLESGMELFNLSLTHLNENKIFDGKIAFKLYDTFGFPLDLTNDMLRSHGACVDMQGFENCMQEQVKRSKASWKGKQNNADFSAILNAYAPNEFVGYETTECLANALGFFDSDFKEITEANPNQEVWVLLEKTPFYAEGGGAIGDRGTLFKDNEEAALVLDTKNFFGLNFSLLEIKKALKKGDQVIAQVSDERLEIAKHHSATHLLQSALREVLGSHVSQAGSLVESKRLRFDFSHAKALNDEELEKVEDLVNAQIFKHLTSQVEHMPLNQAKDKGALALFSEKYAENVRVVSFKEASIELCGGIHVENTGLIGGFRIVKESGVSSGVRRIEAVCGKAFYQLTKEENKELKNAKTLLKNNDVIAGINKLKESVKNSQKAPVSMDLPVEKIHGVNLVVGVVEQGDIKEMIDRLKSKHEKLLAIVFKKENERITLACGVKNVPIKANAWANEVAQILGGKGGGRDDFASAGGKDIENLQAALNLAKNTALKALEG